MKKAIRLVALVLVMVSVAAVLSACGGSNSVVGTYYYTVDGAALAEMGNYWVYMMMDPENTSAYQKNTLTLAQDGTYIYTKMLQVPTNFRGEDDSYQKWNGEYYTFYGTWENKGTTVTLSAPSNITFCSDWQGFMEKFAVEAGIMIDYDTVYARQRDTNDSSTGEYGFGGPYNFFNGPYIVQSGSRDDGARATTQVVELDVKDNAISYPAVEEE